jgi:putative transposase
MELDARIDCELQGGLNRAVTIKEICETRIRYGYRRVHVLLRREG